MTKAEQREKLHMEMLMREEARDAARERERQAVAVSRASTAGRGIVAMGQPMKRRQAFYRDMMETQRKGKRSMKHQNKYWAALKAMAK